jgi:peptidoglycan/xylan/chitin deacetylase (PgdA/CDA1 family)
VSSAARRIKDFLVLINRLRASLPHRETNSRQVFIFAYHRINTTGPSPLGVDLAVFAEQLALFAESGTVLTPERFFLFLQGESPLPSQKNFLITFDDGYVSTVERALPVMERNGLRAISFIATDLLGMPDTSRAGYHLTAERFLRVDEVKATQSTFLYQSHGHAHIDYRDSSRAAVLADMKWSMDWFEAELGYRPTSIAYPFGLPPRWQGWQADLSQLGVRWGFVTGSHSLRVESRSPNELPMLRLPRVGYLTDEVLEHTRARLNGGLTSLRLLDAPVLRRIRTWKNKVSRTGGHDR